MKKLILSLAAMAAATTISAQKMLVLYYSETGTTKTVAQELQKQLGADIESIECEKPYSGNFQETMQRGQREMQSQEWPAIKPLAKKVADYDIVFLGYPIWFGTYANPIVTLLKEQDFAGKTIVPFCTFGSGGLNTSSDALKKALPKANEAGQEALLDILANYPGNEQVFQLAQRLFRANPDRRALFAGYLGKLGDDRAMKDLMAAANDPELNYIDYLEIRNAIERLGGTAPERTFEGDPTYEALSGMQ